MSDNRKQIPILPLRRTVLFPGCVGTVQIRTRRSLKLLEDLQKTEGQILLIPLRRSEQEIPTLDDFSSIGVLARPIAIQPASDKTFSVTFETAERVRLIKLSRHDPYLTGDFETVPVEPVTGEFPDRATQAYDLAVAILKSDKHYSAEVAQIFAANRHDVPRLIDFISHHIQFPFEAKRELLAEENLEERLTLLSELLDEESRRLQLETELKDKVEESISKTQRDLYLRTKLREIRKELGEEIGSENPAASYRHRTQMLPGLPLEVKERVFLETERLKVINCASAEYGMVKNYLDWLLAIPWNKLPGGPQNLVEVEKIISSCFYGSQNIKERIIEYLAAGQLTDNVTVPALCLCGPSGTGKAALAHAIADSLGRKEIRFSVAGVMDAIEIRGEPHNIMGAMPGKIVTSLIEAECMNPVILIEDLDKLCGDEGGVGASLAFLGVIDPRQNHKSIDDYLGLPIDLSRVTFIFSVQTTEGIPEALVERMELIEFAGYIDREKLLIAQKYLIPSILKSNGIAAEELSFTAGAIKRLIQNYTMEAGLGQLKARIETICRRFSKVKATSPKSVKWAITEDDIEEQLGTPIYIPEKGPSHPEVGVATGVAWTGSGGDIMMIEGLKMRGGGSVTCTGSLGEVMRESVQAAHSFVRSKAELLSIPHEDFANHDIHIHFPQGAIPKDGPSAGATISLVIASVMSNRPIRNDIAITGEVSLRGKVLPVSGVKEKVAAAHRAGIYKFVLPSQNKKDLK
ncbi:MAG: endopeptidase La, partial [candidate division Zixibacteria bacterium]|nr:endopeptidase La [candidate division Zixibacteria bacterium]